MEEMSLEAALNTALGTTSMSQSQFDARMVASTDPGISHLATFMHMLARRDAAARIEDFVIVTRGQVLDSQLDQVITEHYTKQGYAVQKGIVGPDFTLYHEGWRQAEVLVTNGSDQPANKIFVTVMRVRSKE